SWLSSPDRFIRLPGSAEECRLDFNAEELEWLLQILNDIRVGSWVRLGAPDLDMVKPEVTPDNLRYAWALDVSGCFQAALLRAIE
ncbi:MAG TPA: hypothetical protein VHH73_09790, partial [Verrucomicrobiae bacterium]|nr:hypothetical protein [Verrucomicrobiae bacterium]